MSSILDALKKLEEEKAARKAAERGEPRVFEAHRAESDLLGDRGIASLQKPWLLVGGIVLAVVAGLSISLVWTMLQTEPAPVEATIVTPVITRPPAPKPPVAPAVPEAPIAEPPEAPVVVPPPVSDAPDPITTAMNRLEAAEPPTSVPLAPPAEEAPEAAPILEPIEPEPVVESPAPVVPKPAPVEPEPAPAVVAPPAPEPPAPAPQPEWSSDITRWPMMLSADRARYGLTNIKLNVLRAATKTHRNALAVINLDKVYVGDIIPNSKGARLVGVSSKGIGIEITSNGQRFFIPN